MHKKSLVICETIARLLVLTLIRLKRLMVLQVTKSNKSVIW